MKKTMRILSLLLVLVSIFALSSCSTRSDEKKTEALELMENINEKMGSFDSFQISLTMDVVYFVDGKAVNAYSEGNQITAGIVSGNFQTYTKTETEISSENLEENQKITSKEGYYNGNYFLTTKGDYYNQKIYSPLTTQEAFEFVLDGGITFSGYFDCKNIETSIDDNGGHRVTSSGYSKEAIDLVCDHYGIDKLLFEKDIVDVQTVIITDSSYCVSEVSLDFVFEGAEKEDNGYKLKIVEKYSAFNEAHIYAAMVNLSNHVEVYDIRILKAIDDMMDDLYNRSSGSFELSSTETEEGIGQTYTNEKFYDVVYGENESGYHYTLTDKNGITTQYKDGYETELGEAGFADAFTMPMTETEAKNKINSFINSGGFSVAGVTDIKKISDGVYEISCQNNLMYDRVNQGWELRKVIQTITFTVENNKIIKIESNVYVSGVYKYYQHHFDVTKTIDTVVDFQPQKPDEGFLER